MPPGERYEFPRVMERHFASDGTSPVAAHSTPRVIHFW
jgi:hypothetical protein